MSDDKRLVLDLETQKSFQEVEGRQPSLLKISLVGIYDYAAGEYRAYMEHEIPALEALLATTDLLIGFNIRRFDLEVLAPYLKTPIAQYPVLDMMEDMTRILGHRVSLNSLAEATLGQKKSGDGLDALRFFKDGRWDELTSYCLKDVQITKDLYEYGLQYGELKCTAKYTGQDLRIPVNWNTSRQRILNVLDEAFKRHLRIDMEYVTTRAGVTERHRNAVDIYHIDGGWFEGYCHRLQGLRHFRVERVLDARPTFMTYQVPLDYHGLDRREFADAA